MSAFAKELGRRLPSPGERTAANQLRKILASQAQGNKDRTLTVMPDGGPTAEVVLTASLSDLLIEVLRHIGAGDAVTLVPVSQMLSTQQAADILNVSRPFLISMIERGDIDCTLVGRHRRIKADALFEYKRKRDQERATALSELAELDADLI